MGQNKAEKSSKDIRRATTAFLRGDITDKQRQEKITMAKRPMNKPTRHSDTRTGNPATSVSGPVGSMSNLRTRKGPITTAHSSIASHGTPGPGGEKLASLAKKYETATANEDQSARDAISKQMNAIKPGAARQALNAINSGKNADAPFKGKRSGKAKGGGSGGGQPRIPPGSPDGGEWTKG